MDRLTAILIAVGALILVASILYLARRTHLRSERRWRLWEQAATRLGSSLKPRASSILVADELSFSTIIDGVTIDLLGRLGPPALRRPTESGTEIRAATKGSLGLELTVSRCEAPPRASTDRGSSPGGDSPECLVVRSSNEDLARAWLSHQICQEIEACPSYRFSISDGEVTATCDCLEVDVDVIERAARAVALMAGGGQELLRRTRAMAAELGGLLSARSDVWEPDGSVLTVVERQGTQVLIDSVGHGHRGGRVDSVFSRIRVRPLMTSEAHFVIHGHQAYEPPDELASLTLISHDDVDFSQHFTVLTNDVFGFSERLSTSVRQRIQGLRPALVTGDGREVTMLLKGVVLDATVVTEALDLAVELATTSTTR